MKPIEELLYLLVLGRCTDEEKACIDRWAEADPQRRRLIERLSDTGRIGRDIELFSMVNSDRALAEMQRRIDAVRPGRRFSWRHIATAASLALLVGLGAAFVFLRPQTTLEEPQPELLASVQTTETLDEIQPGVIRAVLLSEDRNYKMELSAADTAGVKTTMLTARNIPDNAVPTETHELCLDVPRGAEFKIILEDSTEVWLNAESTLRYPENFDAGERRVSLSGEAYFSVRHDAGRPFYVDAGEQTIRVYGTEFNVRVYNDDPFVYTTLESGSIAICRRDFNSAEVLLKPGLQARLDRDKLELDLRPVNTSTVTSWRNSRFVFEEQTLSAIMRDLSRWYNFDYEFADESLKDIVFKGSIPRYSDLATACSIIEMSGELKFSLTNGKVLVSKKRR